MSLQTIIDGSSSININRRNLVGIQYTRNEIPRVSETPSKNPWRFTVSMPNSLRYSQARSIIESIDTLDRINPEVVTFSNNPNMNWIFRYQGVMNASQIANLRVVSFIGNQLILNGLPITGSNRVLFEPNDLIQIGSYAFPFTSTTQVLRGTGSTVTITTSRPNILSDSVVNLGLTVGSGCEFTVFCPNMPTYKLYPGGQIMNSDGTILNNAYIEWSDNFELYEFVGLA